MVGALQEAVVITGDLAGAVPFYERVAGWRVVYRGGADASQWQGWDARPQSAEEVVLANPGTPYGYLRLLQLEGVEQDFVRSSALLWDTGGIFNLNLRTPDAARKYREMRTLGWVPHGGVKTYDFGALKMREAMLSGRDLVSITLVERVTPPLTGWDFGELSHVYNSLQTVRDFEASRRFYTKGLGFEVTMDAPLTVEKPGENVFGLPHNLAPSVTGRLGIFKPPGAAQSTVELLSVEGMTGEDVSERAVPPNLGLVMLRFVVDDVAAYFEQLKVKGVSIQHPPHEMRLEPYGFVKVMSVRSPEGAWLEFLERTPQRSHA